MSTDPTSLADHLGSEIRVWEGALRGIATRRDITDEQRDRWAELYEYEIARLRGDGVTRDECGRIRARLETWTLLGRALPTHTPPEDSGFDLYAAVRKRLAEQRTGGERVPVEEIERAARDGRAAYFRWYTPIEDTLSALERTIAMLERFGTGDDREEVARLCERGDTIYRWLHHAHTSGLVPWLPEYCGAIRGIDQWWRGRVVDRKTYSSVCSWWESRHSQRSAA